jgi:hypothetical protein
MRSGPRNDKAERGLGEVVKPDTKAIYDLHLTELTASVKALLIQGRRIRLIDWPPAQRAALIGVIAILRDELPIGCRWVTIRESHLSETRLRARCYVIDGAFLRDGGAS